MNKDLLNKINAIIGEEEVIKEGEFDVDNVGGDELDGGSGAPDDLGGDDDLEGTEDTLSSWISTVEGDIDPGSVEEIKSFIQFKIEQGGSEDLDDDSDLDDLERGNEIDIEVEEEYDIDDTDK